MAPVRARLSPICGSSNFGHSTPGVSKSSSPLAMVTHCCPRVTPGLSAASTLFLPTSLLISVDLPTLGMPTIITRMERFLTPRFSHLSITGCAAFCTAATSCFTPLPVLQSITHTGRPLFLKMSFHASVLAGSAISTLFKAIILGFCPKSWFSMGLVLLRGTRASSISTTTSTSLSCCSIMRLALVIWPGNHCILKSIYNTLPIRAAYAICQPARMPGWLCL